MKLLFNLKATTKTCYRFESRNEETFVTLYLKKTDVDADGIDPTKPISVEIKQAEDTL